LSLLRIKRKKILYAVVVVLLLSILMSWSTNNPQRTLFLERLIAEALSPFQKAASAVTSFFVNSWEFFGDIRNVYRDNQGLRAELDKYTGMDLLMLEIQQENVRLRALLQFQEAVAHQVMPAQVIGRNPSSWFSTLTIDKGSKHGIKVDMPVVTNQGLVGKIVDVQPSHAKVQLIISTSSGISAIVQRTRDNGVLVGLANPRGYTRITRLHQYADIQEGDVIISSPLTGIFPKGLSIGRVVEVYDDPVSLERSALVLPEVDFDRLEEVLIIINYHAAEEEPDIQGGEQ
jgi:rod shape-determining protein MreC